MPICTSVLLLGLERATAFDYSRSWIGGLEGDATGTGFLAGRDEGRVVVFYPLFDLRTNAISTPG